MSYRQRPSCARRYLGCFATFVLLGAFVAGYVSDLVLDSWLASPLNPANTNPVALDEETEALLASMEDSADGRSFETNPLLIGRNRTTVLLMGLDRRTGDTFATRTDTMILLSLDPEDRSATIVSIPRDLYVDIPNFGQGRINTAFVLGARDGGEAGGAALAIRTIEQNLGIQVDHYALLDFDAVVKLIDRIGGLTIDVPKIINDPQYPDENFGYDPLYIDAGEQTMDGELALKYMRTRHGDSDFNRSERQQQVMLAFRDKLLAQGISDWLRNTPAILQDLRGGLLTDLSTNDILLFADAASQISGLDIEREVLDYEYVSSYTTPGGGSVLVLRDDTVNRLVGELFD